VNSSFKILHGWFIESVQVRVDVIFNLMQAKNDPVRDGTFVVSVACKRKVLNNGTGHCVL